MKKILNNGIDYLQWHKHLSNIYIIFMDTESEVSGMIL